MGTAALHSCKSTPKPDLETFAATLRSRRPALAAALSGEEIFIAWRDMPVLQFREACISDAIRSLEATKEPDLGYGGTYTLRRQIDSEKHSRTPKVRTGVDVIRGEIE